MYASGGQANTGVSFTLVSLLARGGTKVRFFSLVLRPVMESASAYVGVVVVVSSSGFLLQHMYSEHCKSYNPALCWPALSLM